MAHSIKTFAFVLSLIGLSMGGDYTPESRRLPQERPADPPLPDITLMYKDGGDLITYATTSINSLTEDENSPEERCFPDVDIKATQDGCEFWRGIHKMQCSAKFTKDGDSGKFDAMSASCRYYFSEADPMRTHEQILHQAVLGQTTSFGWIDHGYCAVFNVTYLGGFIRWGGESLLPGKESFGATPDYVLRATPHQNFQETSCWKKLEEITRETDKTIKRCR